MDPLLTYRGAVFAWHCDHMGHMNVMWYVGKFDEASWNFLASIGISPSYMREEMRGMVAVEHKVSYKRELLAGDIVEVHSFIREVREKAILFTHEMRNGQTGEVAALCEFTGVHIDRKVRKACAFSPEMRAAAAAFVPLRPESLQDAA
jgi:acyl-CoA thioester hydrolase